MSNNILALGVGKTSILMRELNQRFDEKVKSTIGASFSQLTMIVEESKVVLQVWDTAGQERFRSLVTMYYRNAAAAILVYDITDNTSFLQMKSWIEELNTNVGQPVALCLVGNKTDLEERREVKTAHAASFANSIGALFFETSAISSSGINEAFQAIARTMYEEDTKRVEELGDFSSYPDIIIGHQLSLKEQKEGSRKCSLCVQWR